MTCAALRFGGFTEAERARFPPVPQRLLRRHPGSGRLSLFLSAHIGRIQGWLVPEALERPRGLTEHATRREFVFRHRWRRLDLVTWENRCTMRRARPFADTAHARDVRRVTVKKSAPTLERAVEAGPASHDSGPVSPTPPPSHPITPNLTGRTPPMRRRALLAALALPLPALAQSWSPSRAIRLIAPYPPGGGVDTTSRLLAGPMGAFLGQQVVVENRGGAGGSIGAAELARAAPDGHTVMVDAMAHTVNPSLIRGLPFDYATAFTPISQLVVLPQILVVNPATPARTLAEFVAHVKARPGQLSYGSSGNATAAHLAAALLVNRAGLDIQHVPYRGGTPALQDLLGGSILFVFGTVSSTLQLARDGRLRALAVSTASRIASLPEVPTIAEQGFPGFELNEWNGFYAPAGLTPAMTERWHAAATHALADAAVRQRLDALGAVPVGTAPADFARYVAEQRAAMARLVQEARIEAG